MNGGAIPEDGFFAFMAYLARAHAGALTHQPVKVVAIPRRHLRLVKDSAPELRTSSGEREDAGVGNDPESGAECVVCDDRGCDVCRKVGA